MRKTVILTAAAVSLAAAPIAAQAQNTAAKPAATQPVTGTAASADAAKKPTPEQIANFQRAVKIIRLFTEAFKSDKVSTAVKGRLITCLYDNTLAKISDATGNVLKNSPALDESKPIDIYRASAGVCGIVFKKAAEGGNGKAAGGAKPSTGK